MRISDWSSDVCSSDLAKMKKGEMDLDDMAGQLRQLRSMGGLKGVMGLLPGIGKLKGQMEKADIDDGLIRRQEAILSSMTPRERRSPRIIHASRKRRIAAGSGTSVQEVNKLMKQFMTMSKMMKKVGRMDKKALMRHGLPDRKSTRLNSSH